MISEIDVRPPVVKQAVIGSGVRFNSSGIAALGNISVTLDVSMDGYILAGIQTPRITGTTSGTPVLTYVSGTQIVVTNASSSVCKATGNVFHLVGTFIWVRSDLME